MKWLKAKREALGPSPQRKQIRCNLCQKTFRRRVRFQRFCEACKSEDELFRFAEWMNVEFVK
jgi:Zn finger protein HypA/HybF involved in hydrogenase expression